MAHLLIVDDNPHNIQILATMLSQQNYSLSFAQNGQMALKLIAQQDFDLILLDIQMPDINGFEVCERLKANPQTADIPVIFITATVGSEHIIRGFKLGAVDYINKPLEQFEIQARVRTHLELKRTRDQLQKQNQELSQLNREKSRLLEIVSHDLRTPLTVIVSGLEWLKRQAQKKPEALSFITARVKKMESASERMEDMITHFLNQKSIESGQVQRSVSSFNLDQLIQEICITHREWLLAKAITLYYHPDHQIEITNDRGALVQVVENLLSNAIKFSPQHRDIWLKTSAQNQKVKIEIIDEGPGFSQEELVDLFERTGPRSAMPTFGESSTGLGLSIVRKMVKHLNGHITCRPTTQGSHFIVEFPQQLHS